jgi:hypothetical protein
MPSQLFRITRAPEAEPIAPQRIKRLIYADRDDSDWDVQEVEMLPARIVSVERAEALRRKNKCPDIKESKDDKRVMAAYEKAIRYKFDHKRN